MTTSRRRWRTNGVDPRDLEAMIAPDMHRPGPARARLQPEEIPVWAIVGHVWAVAGTPGSVTLTDEIIARVAADFDVSPRGILAALHYYQSHREAIDALLEANAAALA